MKKKEIIELIENQSELIQHLSMAVADLNMKVFAEQSPIKEIISQKAIDQIKEADNAISRLDKSLIMLGEKLLPNYRPFNSERGLFEMGCKPKECEHRHLIKKDVEYTNDDKPTVYMGHGYVCDDCGEWIGIAKNIK